MTGNKFSKLAAGFIFLGLSLTACVPSATKNITATPPVHFQFTLESSASQSISKNKFYYFIDPSVPMALNAQTHIPEGWTLSPNAQDAGVIFGIVPPSSTSSQWVYALVSPFPQVLDGVAGQDLISTWQGKNGLNSILNNQTIFVNPQTMAAISAMWGKPGDNITVLDDSDIYPQAFKSDYGFAIIPFEHIGPHWKVIKLDGISPLDRQFNANRYALVIHFGLKIHGDQKLEPGLINLPQGNRDGQKLTVLTMTGTTALVRGIGERMAEKGIDYPAQGGILDWFLNSDFVHISNESSFASNCPAANIDNPSLKFCSRPETIQLLDTIHANIIELTGNHNQDWNASAFKESLELYKEHHMMVYAGGVNIDEAQKPLKIEHNGNKFAFLGCNQPGPEIVWAGPYQSGTAKCDFDFMKTQIHALVTEGYLPIVTLQYAEGYDLEPMPQQRRDFDALADAGAVIVSGSQAHSPQTFSFRQDHFVHYGLGNLFFDMMRNPDDLGTTFDLGDPKPIAGVRVGVLDRHVFYNGKYINTELLTDILQDYAQPRPLTFDERRKFLTELFKASGY